MARWINVVGGLCALLALPSAAAAQREAVSNGADAVVTDGTVVATAESGAAIWYNPGALQTDQGPSFDLSGSVYSMRLARDDELLTTASGESAHSGQFEFRVVPRALSFDFKLRDDIVFAAGIIRNLLSQASLKAELEANDGSTWSANHRSDGTALHIPFALAWQFREDLTFGWAVDAVYATQFTLDVVGSQNAPGLSGDPYASTDHRDWYSFGPQARFGLLWKAPRGYRIGWMVASPTLGVYESFYRLKTHSGPGNGREVTAGPIGVTRRKGGEFDQLQPGRTRLGLARVWGQRGWLALDTDVRFPLTSKVRFDTGWGTTLRLGCLWSVRQRMRIGGSLFTVTERDVILAGFGAETLNSYGANFGVDITNQQVPGFKKARISLAMAVNYAYGLGTRTGLRVDPDPTANAPQLRDYDIRVHDIAFNLALRASR